MQAKKQVLDEHDILPIVAEDRFTLLALREARTLVPEPEDAATVGLAVRLATSLEPNGIAVFDLRGLPQLYADVADFLSCAMEGWEAGSVPLREMAVAPQVLLRDDAAGRDLAQVIQTTGFKPLFVRGEPQTAPELNLSEFIGPRGYGGFRDRGVLSDLAQSLLFALDAGAAAPKNIRSSSEFDHAEQSLVSCARDGSLMGKLTRDLIAETVRAITGEGFECATVDEFATTLEEFAPVIGRKVRGKSYAAFDGVEDCVRAAYLSCFLQRSHRHSLLVEHAIQIEAGRVHVVPYHSHAGYPIHADSHSSLLIAKPSIIATRTAAFFRAEIERLNALLNDGNASEDDYQEFFEEYPHFLRSLGYQSIHPRVVLERENGSLVPDFLLEPLDGDWCDILDLKLPSEPLLAGTANRRRLSAAVTAVAAQLREYANYFDEGRHREFVRKKYGLRAHKPRLIAVIGRSLDPRHDEEVRRAMTEYSRLEIVTYDDLLRHAKSRMLI